MGSSQSTPNETDTTEVVLESDDDGEVKVISHFFSLGRAAWHPLFFNLQITLFCLKLKISQCFPHDLVIDFFLFSSAFFCPILSPHLANVTDIQAPSITGGTGQFICRA